MNILTISNLYPPFEIGGCELHCQEVMDELQRRGHTVSVLTSRYGLDRAAVDGHVYRLLWCSLDSGLGSPRATEKALAVVRVAYNAIRDNRIVKTLIRQLQPDVVSVWNTDLINRSILSTAAASGIPMSYMMRGYYRLPKRMLRDKWIGLWSSPSPHWQWTLVRGAASKLGLKGALAALSPMDYPELVGPNCIYNSRFTQMRYAEEGVDTEGSEVIYGGLLLDSIPERANGILHSPIRLLYCGRIGEAKGVRTTVEAMGILTASLGLDATLTLVGGTIDDQFVEALKQLAADLGISDRIVFAGQLPKDEVLQMYAEHDIFIFPSIADEPYGWTLREAMAARLPVVGTAVGGAAEILVDGETGLTFPPGDAHVLASRLARSVEDPASRERMAGRAQEKVREQCSFVSEIDRFERHLRNVMEGRQGARA